MYTFKSNSSKSNAKRFLVQTCKLEAFEQYLTQNAEGQWGTWLDGNGKPVTVGERGALGAAAPAPAPAPEPEEPVQAPSPAASAFGAFAVAQLTAAPAPAPSPAPAPAGATTGMKIQKDRETRNGVQLKSEGSVGAKLFALYDAVGPDCTLAQARAVAEVHGLSPTSAAIGLYMWRKFHGYSGKAK